MQSPIPTLEQRLVSRASTATHGPRREEAGSEGPEDGTESDAIGVRAPERIGMDIVAFRLHAASSDGMETGIEETGASVVVNNKRPTRFDTPLPGVSKAVRAV
jgi:hypothetical protein